MTSARPFRLLDRVQQVHGGATVHGRELSPEATVVALLDNGRTGFLFDDPLFPGRPRSRYSDYGDKDASWMIRVTGTCAGLPETDLAVCASVLPADQMTNLRSALAGLQPGARARSEMASCTRPWPLAAQGPPLPPPRAGAVDHCLRPGPDRFAARRAESRIAQVRPPQVRGPGVTARDSVPLIPAHDQGAAVRGGRDNAPLKPVVKRLQREDEPLSGGHFHVTDPRSLANSGASLI